MALSNTSGATGEQSYTTMERGDVEAIGAHCQFPYCNQLDFLPFRCGSCKGTYCLEHRTENTHRCPRAGEWAAARRRQSVGQVNPGTRLSPKPTLLTETQCSHPQCKTFINTPRNIGVQCSDCNRQYCLKHRFQESHDCAKLTPLGARPVDSGIQGQTEKAKVALARLRAWGKEKQSQMASKTKTNSNTARILALNNLKRTAKGDEKIPQDKRIYLHVEAESSTTTSKLPKGDFFYNREWSIGRVLDAAARSLQIQNLNNSGKGEQDKLRVFHVEGGRLLEYSEKLGEVTVTGNTIVLLRGVGPAIPDLIQA